MKKLLVLTNFVLILCIAAVNANAQTFTRITSGPLICDFGGFFGTAWGDEELARREVTSSIEMMAIKTSGSVFNAKARFPILRQLEP